MTDELKEMDKDGSKTVDFSEFTAWLGKKPAFSFIAKNEVLAKEMFSRIDTDKSGDLSITEMATFEKKFGDLTAFLAEKSVNTDVADTKTEKELEDTAKELQDQINADSAGVEVMGEATKDVLKDNLGDIGNGLQIVVKLTVSVLYKKGPAALNTVYTQMLKMTKGLRENESTKKYWDQMVQKAAQVKSMGQDSLKDLVYNNAMACGVVGLGLTTALAWAGPMMILSFLGGFLVNTIFLAYWQMWILVSWLFGKMYRTNNDMDPDFWFAQLTDDFDMETIKTKLTTEAGKKKSAEEAEAGGWSSMWSYGVGSAVDSTSDAVNSAATSASGWFEWASKQVTG